MAEFIGIRKLHTDLKEIARRVEQGEEFVVSRHNKPLFMIRPCKDKDREKKYTLRDFKKLRFRSGMKNAGSRIDEIVYGKK